jgi:hypothetical protein
MKLPALIDGSIVDVVIRYNDLSVAIYNKSCVGCCCHIVLDDFNYEAHHVEFCLEEAKKNYCSTCKEMCELLLSLPSDEHRKVMVCPDYVDYGDDE